MRLNTFDQVVDWYNKTKPVISKHHTKEDDVRPFGERRRKWERIVKFDDNTYGLTSGDWDMLPGYGSGTDHTELTRRTAVLLWEKREDGEYLSIRGCIGSGYSVPRYKFLSWYLPYGLWHEEEPKKGYHAIKNRTSGEVHELPKIPFRYDWNNRKVLEHTDKSLVFKRIGNGQWERIGSVSIRDTKINHDLKKEFKPAINSFYKWMMAMAPLLSDGNYWQNRVGGFGVLRAAAGLDGGSYARVRDIPTSAPLVKVIREVVCNEDHECRVALAKLLLSDMNADEKVPKRHSGSYSYERREYIEGPELTAEEVDEWYKNKAKRMRAAYNRSINKMLNLHATKEV